MNDAVPEGKQASAAQRQRSAALVVLMIVLAAAGALARAPSTGTAPTACDAPVLVEGVLTCGAAVAGKRAGGRAWLTGAKLDVNTATARELEAIPDVGPSLANAIVSERERRGTFASVNDLDDVPGVGPKTLAKLRAYVR